MAENSQELHTPDTPVTVLNQNEKRNASPMEDVCKKSKLEVMIDASLVNELYNKLSERFAVLFEEMSHKISADLRREIQTLKGQNLALKNIVQSRENEIKRNEEEIVSLKEKVDHLEQYSRRSSIRINGIPEQEGENTEDIVYKLGEAIGADIFSESIDRSHRVGKKDDRYTRPIIVKFTSYKHKASMMRAKKKLRDVDCQKLFRSHSKVYINEDLTAARADMAAKARKMKKDGRIQDTWTWDGTIFVKKLDGAVRRITTIKGLSEL